MARQQLDTCSRCFASADDPYASWARHSWRRFRCLARLRLLMVATCRLPFFFFWRKFWSTGYAVKNGFYRQRQQVARWYSVPLDRRLVFFKSKFWPALHFFKKEIVIHRSAMRWRMDFTDCDSTRCADIASLLIAGLHFKNIYIWSIGRLRGGEWILQSVTVRGALTYCRCIIHVWGR